MTALPSAWVDIWPADGGAIHLSAAEAGLLHVSTSKDIWDPSSGNFQLILAPGGPWGPNASPQWADIITPMSLVIIGLQRNVQGVTRSHIVMAGVVTEVSEDVEWKFDSGVHRAVQITGQDFSYFFSQSCSYCTTLTLYGEAYLPQLGLTAAGVSQGSPDGVAKQFYNQIVAGARGIMASTTLHYDGSPVKLTDLLGTDFRKYPNLPIQIPAAWQFLSLEGSWFDSFKSLLPFPWYELFLATAEPGQYGQTVSSATLSIGDNPHFAPANPALIARPLPLPTLVNPSAPKLDTSLWDALPVFMPDNGGLAVLAYSRSRSVSEIRNFYTVNPLILSSMFGGSNGQIAPWLFQQKYGAWIDVTSMERYGYRPNPLTSTWFSDSSGQQAQSNAGKSERFQEMVGVISLLPVGFHEPTTLMSNAQAVLNLRPDIYPGVRFRCVPGKNGISWDYYVRQVSHSFTFGEPCTTTLGLCRGLPTAVYQDDPETLLAIHMGRGELVDGQFAVNAKASGIVPFNMNTSTFDLAQLAPVFGAPGAQ